jgi:hypothetical protein
MGLKSENNDIAVEIPITHFKNECRFLTHIYGWKSKGLVEGTLATRCAETRVFGVLT